MKLIKSAAATAALLSIAATSVQAGTLEDVRAAGFLKCGVSTGVAGFAFTDDAGNWQGFDPAFCKAVAAAVLGDASKVKYTPTTGKTRFEALKSGEVDVLARNTTWTYSRDADLKLTFIGVNYYDGQGFLIPKEMGVGSAKELDGASVCIQTGTTTELNLAEYFRVNGISYEPVAIETNAEGVKNYAAGRCDVYTTDASGLAATRAVLEDAAAHVILPEIISKEPLGPLVRHGDDQWADINRWVLNALIIAEEVGVTKANVGDMAGAAGDNPEINRLLGTEGEFAAMVGLEKSWAADAIAAVGNFGEIFNEFIGPDTDIGLERGLNALWTEGGIIYAPPFR